MLFDEVGALLDERGLLMRQGTIVDATIIAAPPSTKNKSKTRDPEMHQTKKGNQWHFGMKAHIGVDVASGLVHTLIGTAANVADINQTAALLHGRRRRSSPMPAIPGRASGRNIADREVSWNIAVKRGIIKALPKALRDLAEPIERALSQVRAWVEHPFHIVKNLFRHQEAALPRPGQEHRATAHPLRPGQPGHRQENPARASAGLTTPGVCLDPQQPWRIPTLPRIPLGKSL